MQIKQFFDRYFRKPLLMFVISAVIGCIVGFAFISPEITETPNAIPLFDLSIFVDIAKTNCVIILTIYLASIFTKWYGYFIFLFNGLHLGVYVGWILRFDISLLWLILPHGFMEIAVIVATGFIIEEGDAFVRANVRKYFLLLFLHLLATACCAGIEAFITPMFQSLIG